MADVSAAAVSGGSLPGPSPGRSRPCCGSGGRPWPSWPRSSASPRCRRRPRRPTSATKLEHFVAYGVLALLTLRATSGGRREAGVSWTAVAVAWCIAVSYGISDEFHQSFVPGRTADPADVARTPARPPR
ncbi:MAG: VanZ family protein [Vicinamibacterales bacterium]